MPEVPPDPQNPTDTPPPNEGPESPFRAAPSPPLTRPPAPFGAGREDGTLRPALGGPFSAAPSAGVSAASETALDVGAAGAALPPPDFAAIGARAAVLTTTGVPHYGPPAAPPFSYPPGPQAGAVAAPPRRRRSVFGLAARGVRELAETVILALLIFLLVRAVVQNFQVEGRSMDPTFEDGWYLLVNKAIYWEINLETIGKFVPFIDPGDDPTRFLFRGPQRGDIIVFHPPTESGEPSDRDFIKRIVGLPGETVEVRDCTVFINGEALEEPYLAAPTSGTFGPETVPQGQYFVMGDNRDHSSDSRSWHAVPKENIIGLAWLTYWPSDAFHLVNNHAERPGDVSDPPKTPAGCPAGVAP